MAQPKPTTAHSLVDAVPKHPHNRILSGLGNGNSVQPNRHNNKKPQRPSIKPLALMGFVACAIIFALKMLIDPLVGNTWTSSQIIDKPATATGVLSAISSQTGLQGASQAGVVIEATTAHMPKNANNLDLMLATPSGKGAKSKGNRITSVAGKPKRKAHRQNQKNAIAALAYDEGENNPLSALVAKTKDNTTTTNIKLLFALVKNSNKYKEPKHRLRKQPQ